MTADADETNQALGPGFYRRLQGPVFTGKGIQPGVIKNVVQAPFINIIGMQPSEAFFQLTACAIFGGFQRFGGQAVSKYCMPPSMALFTISTAAVSVHPCSSTMRWPPNPSIGNDSPVFPKGRASMMCPGKE